MTPPIRQWPLSAALAGSTLLAITACTPAADTDQPAPISEQPAPTTTGETLRYQDGSYQAEGWYGSLPSHITVDLELDDDTITDVSITNHATDPTSLGYQEAFAEAIGELAVGQPLDDANVDIVAGASGTSEGWNSALEIIRQDADR